MSLTPQWNQVPAASRGGGAPGAPADRRSLRALTALAMLPVAWVLLFVWSAHRIARFDPLASPSANRSRWVRRVIGDVAASRWSRPRAMPGWGTGRAVHRLVCAAALVAVVLGFSTIADQGAARALAERVGLSSQQRECLRSPVPTMDEQPSWPESECETIEFSLRGRFDGVSVFSFHDFQGEHVNVVDGVRRSWRPPPCECRRLRVWWFGGSAAWGYFQGDEHTLPSELAKAAWEHGIALDIENRAMPGWTLGQEARVYAQLTTEAVRPDLVVFYDGANDLVLQKARNERGEGVDESGASFGEEAIDRLLSGGPFDWNQHRSPRPRARGAELPPTAVAEHALNRYRRDMGTADRVAGFSGTPAYFVWQPLLPTAPPVAGRGATIDERDRRFWDSALPVARRQLPERVIDLSDSLDDVDRPVFRDYVHTSEHGARVVARALEERLRPELRRLAGPGGLAAS